MSRVKQENSLRIMEKLGDIKKLLNQDISVFNSNPTYQQSKDHQISIQSQQSKLNRYLPSSIRTNSKQLGDYKIIKSIEEINRNQNKIFKTQLQSKMETLINEEKTLFKNKYDMNDVEYDIRIRQSALKQKSSLSAIDLKIQQLQNRQIMSKSQKQKKQYEETSKKRKYQQQQKNINQIILLRQALYQTKLLNQRLNNKLLKRTNSSSSSKSTQIQKLFIQIQSLKQQLSQIKNKQTKMICPVKIKSRQRTASNFVAEQKSVEQSILIETYNQIQQLHFRISREQKQKLDLIDKNKWLEGQIQKYIK